MGKTATGAVWLDAERTSPYDYYQFWINTDDRDVARFLALFTFLPMEEVRVIETLEGAELNSAKIVLAFEATRLAHGLEAAEQAYKAACEMFGARTVPQHILPSCSISRDRGQAQDDAVPSSSMSPEVFEAGIAAFKLFAEVGLSKSGGEARRLIKQGGAYINGQRIESFEQVINTNNIKDMEIVMRAGKKRFHKIKIMGKK
jgi:tyrosyl-tRNA synthetase